MMQYPLQSRPPGKMQRKGLKASKKLAPTQRGAIKLARHTAAMRCCACVSAAAPTAASV
jgi:hypothetical protein